MTLAGRLGRSEAHTLIERGSKRAIAEKRHLRDVLKRDPMVLSHLSAEEIDSLFEPLSYTGMADTFIARAIAGYRSKRVY
jgi:3-carboxy-cis,cis-muconate cycloisomerase